MGATTIWERWDGQRPDGTFQDHGMNSFNHYAYGAIGDWMYRVSAGLDTKTAGYKHLLIRPHTTSHLEFSKATFDSPYGTVKSGWTKNENSVTVGVSIPANSKATVVLRTKQDSVVTVNGQSITNNKNISDIKSVNGVTEFVVGSGNYTFEYEE